MAPLAGSLLWGLAQSLINVFTPLAREKITKEVARHTDNPEIAEQVATGVIETAQVLTGKSDALEAVVAARTDPACLRQLEEQTLATIDRLAPVLDKMAGWEQQAWNAEEASRQAAAERARADPNDQDVFLTRSIVWMVAVLLFVIASLIGVLSYVGKPADTLIGLFVTIVGGIVAKFGTRYDHRYGSSRSSGAKDVVIGELSRRPPAPNGRVPAP